jgi:UbiD family decarboxylase
MAQDLPAYLDMIKRSTPEEIVVISKEIDPAYELTALVVKLEREGKRRPVLICERMKGTKFPVLTNLHASRSRLALAMGSAPD